MNTNRILLPSIAHIVHVLIRDLVSFRSNSSYYTPAPTLLAPANHAPSNIFPITATGTPHPYQPLPLCIPPDASFTTRMVPQLPARVVGKPGPSAVSVEQ